MKNLLFIPCYNDYKNCKKILNEIDNLQDKNFDILIINDGSNEISEFQSKFHKLILINLKNNFGIGHCMRMAIQFALKNNYKKICRIDSDGEHNPTYINLIFNKLDDKDFIVGQREIIYKQNFFKIYSKKFLNIIINKILNLKFNDYNCGMMGLSFNSMQIISKKSLINYPEPQIIIELCARKIDYEKIKIKQRKRYYGDSSINFLRGFDFILVTFFFILNYIMNRKND